MEITKRNNVKIIGKGSQVIMFAHGFGADQNSWKGIIPAFIPDFKIILFDYVGSGNSDIGSYNASRYNNLSGYADDVIDICKALDLEDVIFVGHSVSSMVGVLASLKMPSLFKKIVFIGPSPRYINDEGYYGGMEEPDLEALLEMMDSNYLGWAGNMAPAIVGNADRPEHWENLSASFCATDPNIAKQFARVTFLSDNRKDLPLLKIPSLTIQCRDDILTSETVAKYILKHTPGNKMVLLDSTGHCPHLTDTDNVIKTIKEFIA